MGAPFSCRPRYYIIKPLDLEHIIKDLNYYYKKRLLFERCLSNFSSDGVRGGNGGPLASMAQSKLNPEPLGEWSRDDDDIISLALFLLVFFFDEDDDDRDL